jgi:hypothetical protein
VIRSTGSNGCDLVRRPLAPRRARGSSAITC